MKKIYLMACLAAAAFASASCIKEDSFQINDKSGTQTVSLMVNNLPWMAEKSSYAPGVGITLSGNEKIGVFYYADDKEFTSGSTTLTAGFWGPTTPGGTSRFGLATPSEGRYTFEADNGTTSYRWTGVMPYSYAIYGITGNRAYFTTRIGPVQFPQQNSFDPMQDILISRSFAIEDNAATINSFKRITAPLRIRVRGLDEGEKIYAASLSVSGQELTVNSCLVACMNASASKTDDGTDAFKESAYNDAKFVSANGSNLSNKVSAVYQDGLAAINDPLSGGKCWPVWFSVCPMTIKSGSQITISVTTAEATYERTVNVTSDIELSNEKLNDIGIGLSDKRKTTSSITQDFLGIDTSNGTRQLTASDGKAYSWTFYDIPKSTAASDRGSDLQLCPIMRTSSTLTIPDFGPLCFVKKVKVYTHVASNSTSSPQKMGLFDGETLVGSELRVNLNRSATAAEDGLYLTGGIAEFTCPAERESLEGLTLKTSSGSGNTYVSRIVFEVVKFNGYKAAYDAGYDIVIGDKTINKTECPDAVTVKLSEVGSRTDLYTACANDVVFIMDEDGGAAGTFTPDGHMDFPTETVLIGDNPLQQPVFQNGAYVFRPKKSLYLKNIHVNCTYGAVIVSNQLTEDSNLAVEDCHMNVSGGVADNHASYCFKELFMKNNVFVMTGNVRMIQISSGTKTTGCSVPTLYDICDNVFAYKNATTSNLVLTRVDLKGSKANAYDVLTPDLEFRFCNNTVYNNASITCLLNNPKTLIGNGNIFEADFTSNTAGTIRMFWIQSQPDGYSGTVCNNYLNYFRPEGANNMAIAASTDTEAGYSGNVVVRQPVGLSGNSVFSTIDLDNGYLPVNRTVVTNGAGADYSTKLWREW